jgi:hypothetical protein
MTVPGRRKSGGRAEEEQRRKMEAEEWRKRYLRN